MSTAFINIISAKLAIAALTHRLFLPSPAALRVHVGHLAKFTRRADLEAAFAEVFGPVHSAEVVYDRQTGASRRFGFVQLTTSEAHACALAAGELEVNGRARTQVSDRDVLDRLCYSHHGDRSSEG